MSGRRQKVDLVRIPAEVDHRVQGMPPSESDDAVLPIRQMPSTPGCRDLTPLENLANSPSFPRCPEPHLRGEREWPKPGYPCERSEMFSD